MFRETQNIADMCISCGACLNMCQFLKEYCEDPKEMAERMLAGSYVADTKVPFMCNICGKCASVCPEGLDIGEMMLEVRRKIVDEDLPLPGMIKFVKNQQKFVTSDEFFLAKPAPSGTTKRMFFPGCHLSSYSPEMVAASWKWINENDPDCGLLLTCCGAPSYDTGDVATYEDTVNRVRKAMEKYGAQELVTACSNCTLHFREYSNGIETVNLYSIMDEKWTAPVEHAQGEWVLHDPCKSRTMPEMQEAARSLIQKAGYQFSEPKPKGKRTRCCGMGGLVAYTDAKWARKLNKVRAKEIKGDLVTFCASCREAMHPHGTPGVHLLDLLFNTDLDAAKAKEPHGMADIKTNQMRTRQLLDEANAVPSDMCDSASSLHTT